MALNESIQKLLNREDCVKILKRSIKGPAPLQSYDITKYRDDVVGFLGDHLRLTVKYSSNNTKILKKTYFVKALPQFNPNQLKYVQEAGIFKKEALVYTNLLGRLSEIYTFAPQCYFVNDDCIVLEDLNAAGFTMLNRHRYLDEEHCRSLIKTLAGYHASTLVLESKLGTTLDKLFQAEIKETCFSFVEGEPRQKWCISNTNCINNLIKLIVPTEHNCQDICNKFHKFVFEEMPKLISPSERFKNVLTHDDLWCNNILYNHQCECVFVDFQLVRYTPPGFDFLVTLLLNTEHEYLENKLEHFIDLYYSYFSRELRKHALKSNILSKTEFEESLEYYRLASLTEAAMYGTHVYISDQLSNHIMKDFNNYNEFSFINRSQFVVSEFQNNPQYRKRLTAILKAVIKMLVQK